MRPLFDRTWPKIYVLQLGRIEIALSWTCASARGIKRSDSAIRRAQKVVTYIATVYVASRDRLGRVDVSGAGTLAGTCPGIRDVKRRDHAVRSAQETMKTHYSRQRNVPRSRLQR